MVVGSNVPGWAISCGMVGGSRPQGVAGHGQLNGN